MTEEMITLSSIIKQFANIRKAYAQLCHRELAQFHFTPCEIDILIFLSNNALLNTAKDLSVYLQVTKSLIARSIESLVARGFLELHKDIKDHRSLRLYLCKEADQCISIIKKKQTDFNKQILHGVAETDLITLQNTLQILSSNINKGSVDK